jgi:hypothetical protein
MSDVTRILTQIQFRETTATEPGMRQVMFNCGLADEAQRQSAV